MFDRSSQYMSVLRECLPQQRKLLAWVTRFQGFLVSIFTKEAKCHWATKPRRVCTIKKLSIAPYSSEISLRLVALPHCVEWLSESSPLPALAVDPHSGYPMSLQGFHCMFSAMCTNSPVFGMYLSFMFACTLCLPHSYHQGYRMISGQTYATEFAPKYCWCSCN